MHLRRTILLALVPVIVLALGTALWIHDNFGINTPWDTPDFFHVCGREYRAGGELRDPATTYTVWLRPTVFDMPIPMPEVSAIPDEPNWGGCPMQLVLERRDGDIVYAFIEGGP